MKSDFESGASTNSATGARGRDNTGAPGRVNAEMPFSRCRQWGGEPLCGRSGVRGRRSLWGEAALRPLRRAIGARSKGSRTMHGMQAFGMQALTRSRPAVVAALLVAAGGAATILGAYYFQYVMGLRPCPLCLEQRIAFYVSI